MFDRLEEIKKVAKTTQSASMDQVDWLIREIGRLRRIEDKAIAWSQSFSARAAPDLAERELSKALSDNSRPNSPEQ